MDPTEFDKFDQLLRMERWDGAFQVGWRVLHRLMRSFYVSLIDSKQEGTTTENRRELVQKIDGADERELFNCPDRKKKKWAEKLTSLDILAVISSKSPRLWEEYERATQLRHFVFHGRIYMERGHSVRSSAEALREMITLMDQLFQGNAHYSHVRQGGPLSPTMDFAFDRSTGTLTIDVASEFDEPEIRGSG